MPTQRGAAPVADPFGSGRLSHPLAVFKRFRRGDLCPVAIGDKGAVYNTDLMETVELGFLLDCADTLVAAARARTESRGGHYREDHPLRDDANWLRHSLASRGPDGSVRLASKPVKMGPYLPMERKY